jgi:hypothetical protein
VERRGLIKTSQRVRMSTVQRVCIGFSMLAYLLLLGCQSTGPIEPQHVAPRSKARNPAAAKFSPPFAWQHLRALNKIGTRVSGTTNSASAREYLRDALDRLEIYSKEQRVSVVARSGKGSRKNVELTHLTAVIPGRSADVLLLAAHYDTPPEIAKDPVPRNDQRASGPALLLELARALNSAATPEYTIWLSWIDGDALDAGSADGASQVRLGTQSLVDEWSRGHEFAQIRAAVFFGDVGDRDQPIVRDIDSPRVYRETFWQVAQDLGYGSTFPADGPYGLSSTGRRTFAQANLRSSIALANLRAPVSELQEEASKPSKPAKPATGVSQHKPAQRSLRPSAGFEAVGNVTLESLKRIAAKLRKIDRFARSPLTAGRDERERRSRRD